MKITILLTQALLIRSNQARQQSKTLMHGQVRHWNKPFQITTTIHKDVTDRLMQINPALAKQARQVLDVNKSERHIRGGMATKEKYLHIHNY